ncbi:hypothetical protein [Brachybacterium hainanense]|uniref:Uncharacterized protein n=1 Tax=Brachybacterium hainanense TaxID=1541174 RepID=A0ABV6RAF5_9MICO
MCDVTDWLWSLAPTVIALGAVCLWPADSASEPLLRIETNDVTCIELLLSDDD